MNKKIKIGSKVKIIIGKDKGKEGIVTMMYPKNETLVVKGLNISKKHIKQKDNKEGEIVDKEMPVHCSNVKII